jgi:hypothetical protein
VVHGPCNIKVHCTFTPSCSTILIQCAWQRIN